MPELPEVETTRRGIEKHLNGRRIEHIIVRQAKLRFPVPAALQEARACTVQTVKRRGKYLLLDCGGGHILMHLGMSGSLRILPADTPPQKHEHVDVVLDNGQCLRYRDPRRFGCVLWTCAAPEQHPLLRELGPEPLTEDFDGAYLHQQAQGRRSAVKVFLMDGRVVVGVGNIYASESLARAGIHPARPAGRISRRRYDALAAAVKEVLGEAIQQGGTTLRDFTNGEGRPGYFQQTLRVYGRAGEACLNCGTAIKSVILGQRASFYCPRCQR